MSNKIVSRTLCVAWFVILGHVLRADRSAPPLNGGGTRFAMTAIPE
jgi:hypothetical protein